MTEKINLVLLGHLDHGKSTLIGRLLYETKSIPPDKIKEVEQMCKNLGKEMEYAFFLDAFQDEVEGGMTIDTIMAVLKGEKHEYNVIDCPGHKEFIKNMLSGASNASSAILVISAKQGEGVQEQTKRHIFLARMLGIEQIFVAVNKMDTRNYEESIFNKIKEEAEKFLSTIGYQNIFFIPISAKKGDNILKKSENMQWYKGKPLFEIVEDNVKKTESKNEKPLRMSIQDIYEIEGEKMIVGRIESGTARAGQEIIFLPSMKKGRIQSIEKFNEKKQSAEAGESIGLRIEGDVGNIKRGEIASELGSQPEIKKELNAEIFVLSEKPIKKNEKLDIRILTRERECVISEIKERINSSSGEKLAEGNEINHLDAAEVKISMQEPIVTEKFSKMQALGRFILIKNNEIIAVGIIK